MRQLPADRFTACCTDAMFGYAQAATAMWWSVTNEALDMCGKAVKAVAEPEAETKPASWFNPRAKAAPFWAANQAPFGGAATPSAADPMAWFGLSTPVATGQSSWFIPPAPAASMLDVWFDMMPLRGGPAAWPMAFFMLSAGVPKAVAWPTAEANAKMMEAAEVAHGQLKSALASYRSEGGYAVMPYFNGAAA